MNKVTVWLGRLGARLKALTTLKFPTSRLSWTWPLRRGVMDYSTVGDGSGNSAVVACVEYIARTFPEAPLQVLRRAGRGEWEAVDEHPLTALLEQPNPFYSGPQLWHATLTDRLYAGNAYWLKRRAGAGKPVELWWLPQWLVEPKRRDGSEDLITHYEYKPDGGAPIVYERDEIVHFRYGFDPENPMKGMSPLRAALGEVFTDEQVTAYTSTLLHNMGVPGIVISPKEKDGEITPDEAVQLKTQLTQKTTGDHRGEALVVQSAVNVDRLSFNPSEMNASQLSDRAEERITAVLGIPAAVVGLGTGLEQTKVGATMAELREQAYESCIIPLQRLLAAELTTQLLRDFADIRTQRVGFDNGCVRVLQDDQDALYERLDKGVRGGWLMVADARRMVNLPTTPEDEVYLRPNTATAVGPGAPEVEAPVEEPIPFPVRESAARPTITVLTKADPPSADVWLGEFESLFERLSDPMLVAVAAFLVEQGARVLTRLDANATALSLMPLEEAGRLRATLEPWYRTVLAGLHEPTQAVLGVQWGLEDPQVLQYLREAGSQITGIDATTRDAVARVLREGRAAGLTPAEIGRQLREDFAFSRSRAETIQRTELAQAANRAALTHYQASGVVVGVVVHDGDFDPVCAGMNGRRFTLAEAGSLPRIAHPNCRRAFAPLTQPEQLQLGLSRRAAPVALPAPAPAPPDPQTFAKAVATAVAQATPAPAPYRVRREVKRDADGRILEVLERHEPVVPEQVQRQVERNRDGRIVAVQETHEPLEAV